MKSPLKFVYFGTDLFSRNILEILIKEDFFPECVVTTPPTPFGRGKKLKSSEVQEFCEEKSVRFVSPKKIKEGPFLAEIKSLKADCFCVVSYGKILPKELLAIPPFGSINVHPSLLPRWRGPSPMQYALWKGDRKTGVSIINVDPDIVDSGDLLLQASFDLPVNMHFDELFCKCYQMGGAQLINSINLLSSREVNWQKQNDGLVTHTKKIQKKDGLIDWHLSSVEIHNQIRALSSGVGAYTFINGKRMKVLSSYYEEAMNDKTFGIPGEIGAIDKAGWMQVLTGSGRLQIELIQMEGKKVMSSYQVFVGKGISLGEILGS